MEKIDSLVSEIKGNVSFLQRIFFSRTSLAVVALLFSGFLVAFFVIR